MTIIQTPAKGTLFYVVGPSGAGKDAVLDWAAAELARDAGQNVRFARRWITRPAGSGGEDHRALDLGEFDRREAAGDFAMAWRANGNRYGIGNEILDWLADGLTVVVSGSRAYLPEAQRRFPALRVISISASPEALQERLQKRAREPAAEIAQRLARGREFSLPPGTVAAEIRNDASLDEAGSALLRVLRGE